MRRSVSRLTLVSAMVIVPLFGLSPLQAKDKPEKAVDADSADAEMSKEAAVKAQDVAAKAADKPKSEWTFKPRGRLLIDAVDVSAPEGISNDSLGFSTEIRRARLGASGKMPGPFEYKIEADFAGSDIELTDAFVAYAKDGLTVTLGQHNNFQSMLELTSSNDESFIERAAFTDAFGFERRVGLSAQYAKGEFLLQGGVFTDNIADISGNFGENRSVDARIVAMPKRGDVQLHFGASAHWRDGEPTARYRQRPLVHATSVRFIATPTLDNVESETSFGLEAAAIAGKFHALAETHWLSTQRSGFDNPGFFGGTIEAGYFLTDHRRGYKKGVFKGPQGKGANAVQIVARYDHLDLNDAGAGVVGGKQEGYMAGISWWPHEYFRLLVNYGRLDYSDAAIPAAGGRRDYSVDVIGARAQFAF